METKTLRKREDDSVKQLSIFADNKVGRLNDLVLLLASHDIHIMALCTVDTTDSSIIRLVVDYWERARDLFIEHGFSFSMNDVVVVQLNTEQDIKQVTCALVQAEINIHYIYPMLMRPRGKLGLVIRLEDNDIATDVLSQVGLKVLRHQDIAR